MAKEKDTKNNYMVVGCDVGTGNLVVAKINENNQTEINSIRDMFIYVQDDQISSSEMSNSKLDYITQLDDNGDIEFHAVIGDDALKMANIFNSKINRPMSKGMLCPSEINASPIITAMIKNIIGEEVHGGQVVFSVPSQPVDIEEVSPVSFHQQMFIQMFKTIGFDEAVPLNEAHSIIFSECSKENFTALSASFGAGQVNIALSYKGALIFSFSIGRSGDFIDIYSGNATGMIPNKITSIKEKSDMSLINPIVTSNKKEKIARQAIVFAYDNLISYVVDLIEEQFKEHADSIDLDESIPFVIAGGTSLIHGFIEKFTEKFNEIKDFPVEISEIRHAKEPLSAIAVGCLIYSQWLQNKKD